MTLDENDYLTYQLYIASKTPRIRKTRIRSWIFTTITFALLAFLFFRSDNSFLTIYFLIAAGLSLIFFPVYSRWRYKNHYLKHIKETYKNRFGLECSLTITDDSITTQDKTGEVRINTSEIEEINEIRDFYFLKSKSGVSIIISKNKSENIETIEKAIKLLIQNKNIRHNIDLEWKWK